MLDSERYFHLKVFKPQFVLNRALRRPTFDGRRYRSTVLSDAERTHLRNVASSAQVSPPNKRMIFLYGVMPRSGTNYLFELLLRHPQIVKSAIPFDELPVLAAPEVYDEPRRMIGRLHSPSAEAFQPMEWMTFSVSGLRNRLLDLAPDDSVTLIKEPHAFNLDLLSTVFPLDQYILIARDGRYVVDSFKRTFAQQILGRTFEDICLEFKAAAEKMLEVRAALPEEKVRYVQYEQCVRHPKDTISSLTDWIGGLDRPPSEEDLASIPVLGSSTHSKRTKGQVSWEPVEADESFDPTSRKLDWSEEYTSTFERICGDVNRRLGYS
ncbi:hypothetical protein PB2503_06802 [Parvularcula bermudensis HTCC2503]|uniref:Sulfotransferase n=1 Tax=Parvularcula bermudensis (strain ATCC BAA-594 / HTCC2503 / KCTC 12087) TaxID=314260 RepID=E0TI87_PARBH|nr:sulfotransferase [Parvularcula bermudensis]ADM09426.1 hypothetical protein PB2503_06802 [Parvularcula bermudensis HTCC2503]